MNVRDARWLSGLVGLALVLGGGAAALGCGDGARCPPGSKRVGSQCRPVSSDDDPAGGADAGAGEDGGGNTGDGGDGESTDGGADAGPNPNPDCVAELCNGTDDDCDGSVDEDVKIDVYKDADGDGSGAGPAKRGCPGPGLSPTNDDCDDGTSTTAPGLPELCDGLDNSCNGETDENLSCQPNQADVACTTVCGSMGKGNCSELCAVPTGDSCVPPAEMCNGKDDDCDGLVDQSLTERVQTDMIAEYPKAMAGSEYEYAQMALTPAPNGQANWFYRAGYNWSPDAPPTAIQGYATARPNQLSQDVTSRTADVGGFIGAGDEQYTVLLQGAYLDGFVSGQSNPWSIRLQAYNASDLTFVSELVPADSRGLKMVIPLAISALRSKTGELHVLIVYARATSDGKQTTAFRVAHLSKSGEWGLSSREVELSSVALVYGVHVARLPCRDEFVLGAVESSFFAKFRAIRRVAAPSGTYVGDDASTLVPSDATLVGLGDDGPVCKSTDHNPELLAAYAYFGTTNGLSHLQHIAVDESTGALAIRGTPLTLGPSPFVAWAERVAGRWFVSTWGKDGDRHTPVLWEHWLGTSGEGILRSVPLLRSGSAQSADPGGIGSSNGTVFSYGGLVRSNDGVLAGFANLTGPGTATSNLDKALAAIKGSAPGGVAAAAYYRIGCP